ncbi:MAG TPA: hypothetical protein PLY02_01355 [Candidatus Pacearchaeota archaeon]|nr:hypothetical protein [Candidatus Pacearchaeota archaeon]HOK94162.1 hypothetical protein [Candidatus Pacearchaeota archaeon]
MRNKNINILILFTFIILGSFFADNFIFGATEVTGGCCDTTIVYNDPLPDQMYIIGNTVHFSGSFRVTSCGDGLFFNKVTFYITEDKEIPITNCCGNSTKDCTTSKSCTCIEGCNNCYGATSNRYSSCNFQWCDKVQYLDVAKANTLGYKVYKLGEIYPPDVASGSKPYWVEYNKTFTIPEDLGFTGPVRFYVQYSGTHWGGHWHWNIVYQKGIINSPPLKPEPVEDGETWNNCQIQGLSIPTFQWTYSDPDGDPQASYEIKIDNDSNFSILDLFDSDKFSRSGGASTIFTPTASDWKNWQKWNTNYWWIVRVKDNKGTWSPWSDPNPFITPLHAYPWPTFIHSPENPAPGEEVTFVDQSICYDFNNNPYSCKDNTNTRYQWDFDNDGQIDCDSNTNPSCRGNVNYNVQSSGNYVKLFITDDVGTCSSTGDTPISTRSPFPEWREIAPF